MSGQAYQLPFIEVRAMSHNGITARYIINLAQLSTARIVTGDDDKPRIDLVMIGTVPLSADLASSQILTVTGDDGQRLSEVLSRFTKLS